MHKFSSSDSFPKVCPIVSFCDLLSLLVPNDYSCRDTFSFVSQIKNANLSKKFLISYDVTHLFTNVQLQETIDIAINLIFNHNPNLNITKEHLKKLFLFATSQAHFVFNSKFYDHINPLFTGLFQTPWLLGWGPVDPNTFLLIATYLLIVFNCNFA